MRDTAFDVHTRGTSASEPRRDGKMTIRRVSRRTRIGRRWVGGVAVAVVSPWGARRFSMRPFRSRRRGARRLARR